MPDDPFYLSPEVEDRVLGEVQRQRRRFAALQRQVTPEMAQRAIEVAQRHPNASPGVVQASAQLGLPDEQVDQLASQDDGGIADFFGDVVGFLSDGVEKAYEYAVKPAIRGAFTLSETLAEEVVQRPLTAGLAAVSGDAPSFGQAYEDYGNSEGVIALRNLFDQDPATQFDLGQGFFAGGAIGEESQAQRTLQIAGQRATLGRALPTSRVAGEMFGYDSFAHNALAGVSQFAVDVLADPLAIFSGGSSTLARGAAKLGASDDVVRAVGGGVAGARQAARQLDPAEAKALYDDVLARAGGVSGNGRNSALIERVESFFGDRGLLEELSKADAYTIYQSFKRSSANHIDTDLIRRLGAATDEQAVSRELLDAVQRAQVTEKGFYSGLSGFRRKVRDSRLGGISPRGKISLDDIDDASEKLDSFLRNARVDRETRADIFERLVKVNDPATPWEARGDEFFDVVTDAMAAVSSNLSDELDSLKRATSLVRGEQKAMRMYGVDVRADPILTPFIKRKVDPGTGAEVLDPTPMLTSELLDEGFNLPDVTEVRRAAKRTSRMDKLYTSKGWEIGADGARWATRDLFKPLAILRPAYVVRIGLEEQARLAAAGYDSLLNHPIRFIQANILARKADASLTGDAWDEVADGLNAINRSAYNVRADGPSYKFTGRVWAPMDKPAEASSEYIEAWRHELAQLSAAREARFMAANGGNLDDFVEWARNTEEGRKVVARASRINPEVNTIATSDDALRAWGDSINQRLAAKAGGTVEDGVVTSLGDADLLDAVASGKMLGHRLTERTAKASLSNALRGKFGIAPAKLKYDTDLFESESRRGYLDRAVDYLFDNITGKPTNTLARYPAFRQGYIKNVRETMDALATDDLRREFAQNLDEMFTLTKAEKLDIARSVRGAEGKVGFYDDISELDEVLKVRSASEVKELLFDVTKRSNIQDAYEVAVPFFDAWAEVTRTWARLVKENPAFFIRAGQGLDSARESGVIYANDFGEEVFAYPGGGLLSQFFPGDNASLRLEGRLQGANLVAQGVGPGFGPVVQWGVGAFMGKDRDLQQLREWLAPFGTGGIEAAGDLSNPGAFVESVTPAWARKAINAFTEGGFDPIQWNSSMGDVAKVLAGSGAYDPANPTDQQRLLDDAAKGTRFVLLMRSLTQGVGLTGASSTWQVRTDGPGNETVPAGWDPEADPDGVFHTLGTLANEYRRLRDHYNYDDELATAAFIELYGVEPYYIGQAKTRSIANLPVDEAGFGWVQQHADAAKEYQSTIGYFVPPDEDAELDYSIYRDQIEAGERQSLTAEQQVQLANKSKAYSLLNAVKKRVAELPPAERDRLLSHTRGVLDNEFPGWQAPVLGVGDTLNSAQRIDELRRAVGDERLADSPVTPTLQLYMRARDALAVQAEQRNGFTLGAKANADLRERLQAVGLTLQARDPAFAGVWSQLLSQEVEDV